MPFESTHVLHYNCALLLPCCAADAFPFEDLRAGRWTLELSQSQELISVGSVHPVESDPPPLELQLQDIEQIGCIGKWMGGGIKSRLKLLPDSLVALRLGRIDQRNVVIGLMLLTHR